jgi:hypothetical protein
MIEPPTTIINDPGSMYAGNPAPCIIANIMKPKAPTKPTIVAISIAITLLIFKYLLKPPR